MVENTKQLGYARDDVFIISINNITDNIEELESKIYIEPHLIYYYFGKVSSLYSKTHKYINKDRNIILRLFKIREALYENKFMEDLMKDPEKSNVRLQYLKLLDNLVKIYREMTEDYTIGIFPKIEEISKGPGVAKRKY